MQTGFLGALVLFPLILVPGTVASCGGDTHRSTGSGAASGSLASSSGSGGGSSSLAGGTGGTGGVEICTPEVCNGIDDDCDGLIDEGAGLCSGSGETCSNGSCIVDCAAPGANPCSTGTVCNVSDMSPGGCVSPTDPCVISGTPEPCGMFSCGPGSTCNPGTSTCVAALPCTAAVCNGTTCHGVACPCQRPAPTCTTAALADLNNAAFMNGAVDLDFDLTCGAWAVTVISGPDYLRHMNSMGQVGTVQGVTNLNMGEVAAVQGENGTFGGTTTDVGLTYNCCATCGCQGTPQGVAFYDQPTSALPLVIPSAQITTGAGPFQSIYLDTGPQGLTWGLARKLYVGNVDTDGDFHAVDLVNGTKGLVTTFPARVYAATPYDGNRHLVALATKEIVLLDITTAMSAPFATMPADVTSLARDPFTGHVYVSLYGGEIRKVDAKGTDAGMFAKGMQSGRIALARDNYLYHINVAPIATASVERFALPATY